MTFTASEMTSGPMPSPGMMAMRFFGVTTWKIINSVGRCHASGWVGSGAVMNTYSNLSFRNAAVSREESAVSLAEADSSPAKPARNDNSQRESRGKAETTHLRRNAISPL
jgi:hypothetical protein